MRHHKCGLTPPEQVAGATTSGTFEVAFLPGGAMGVMFMRLAPAEDASMGPSFYRVKHSFEWSPARFPDGNDFRCQIPSDEISM